MTTTGTPLPDRVATNIRAEMAAQGKTAVELGELLGIGHRAALHRRNGAIPFSLGELERVAPWLGVTIASLMTARTLQAVAS
jgi:transcriptional regulator with XRE-family HTH domain